MRKLNLLSLLFIILPCTVARPWNTSDPCPITLRARISSDPCGGEDGRYGTHICPEQKIQYNTMDVVHRALTHCTSIEGLDLWVGVNRFTEFPNRYTFPFNFSGTDTYPALKSLKLRGYRFEERGVEPDGLEAKCPKFLSRWCKIWRTYQLPIDSQQYKMSYELWRDAMDWSRLEELEIEKSRIPYDMSTKLPPQLKSLKKISMTNDIFINSLNKHTLTHLTWLGHASEHALPSILAHQGKYLTHLEFRCSEIDCPDFSTQFDVSILPIMAPNLKHIAINVPRNGSWPAETLRKIASLPSLESADIYLNIQSPCIRSRDIPTCITNQLWEDVHIDNYCVGEDQFQRPFLTIDGALEMYKLIREARVGNEFDGKVTFYMGDWSEPPLYIGPWFAGKKEKIVCEKDGKVEGQAWCMTKERSGYWLSGGRQRQSYSDLDDEDEWLD